MLNDDLVLDDTLQLSQGAATHKRISWPAVFAGIVVVLAVQLFLSMIGLSIGASSVKPLSQDNPFNNIGTGAAIWLAVSTLVAMFAGGWVAGRLAGIPRRLDSSLHGIISWGFASLIAAYLVSTAAGSALSGATGILGQGLSVLGKGTGNITALVGDKSKAAIEDSGVDLGDIKNQAMTLLQQTGKPELQPGQVNGTLQGAAQDSRDTAKTAALNPQMAGQELSGLIDRIFNKGQQTLSAADREAAVNVLMTRYNVSHDQAESTVTQWQQTYDQAAAKLAQAKAAAEQKAREAGDRAAKVLAKTAAWTAVMMLLGALAAAFGGYEAVPRDILITNKRPLSRRLSSQPLANI